MCSLYMGLIVQLQAEPDLDLMAYARVVRSLFDGTFTGDPSRPTLPSSTSQALPFSRLIAFLSITREVIVAHHDLRLKSEGKWLDRRFRIVKVRERSF